MSHHMPPCERAALGCSPPSHTGLCERAGLSLCRGAAPGLVRVPAEPRLVWSWSWALTHSFFSEASFPSAAAKCATIADCPLIPGGLPPRHHSTPFSETVPGCTCSTRLAGLTADGALSQHLPSSPTFRALPKGRGAPKCPGLVGECGTPGHALILSRAPLASPEWGS